MFDIGEGFGNLTTFVGTTRMSGTPKDRTEAQSVDLAVAWVLYNIKYNSTSIIGILNLQSPHSISNHPTQSPVTQSFNRRFCIMMIDELEIEILLYYKLSCKSRAIPLQAWTGPEGFRRLRLPDFKTVGT